MKYATNNIHSKKIRQRKCLVTGDVYPVHKLIRFVMDPAGNIIPDVASKLPGRGGWILADRKTLETAMKKKTFIRFGHKILATAGRKAADLEALDDDEDKDLDITVRAKSRVNVDEKLLNQVEQLLRQRCLNYLGLVNRAGLLVSGFEKVRSALKAEKCRALIIAKDAADNGRQKLCSGLGIVLEKLRVIDMFSREQLGQTLGLSNAVHVALLPGGVTESFIKEFSRYERVTIRPEESILTPQWSELKANDENE